MKLTLSEDQIILRDSVRRFAERQCQSFSPEHEVAYRFDALKPKLNELGLWSLTAPVDAGGFGQDTLTAALAIEELAKSEPSTAFVAALHLGLFAPTMAKAIGAADILEAKAAIGVSLDGFVIAPGKAPDLLLSLRREPAASALIIKNFDVALNPGLGLNAISTGTLVADDIDGQTLELTPAQLEERLGATSTLLGAVAVGLGRAALNEALNYAAERQQFGRPLNRFQAIQFKLADMGTALDTSGWLLWRAAATDNSTLAGFALDQAVEAAFFAADEALQIHGGYGYTREYAVEALFRDAQELRRLANRWLSFASSGLLA